MCIFQGAEWQTGRVREQRVCGGGDDHEGDGQEVLRVEPGGDLGRY